MEFINLYKLNISVSHIFLSSFKSIKLKKLSCDTNREAEAEEDRVMRELKATMNKTREFVSVEERKEKTQEYTEGT